MAKCPTTGKVMHATKAAARTAGRNYERSFGLERQAMVAYSCPACTKFHIGHAKIRDRLRRAAAQ